MATVLDSFVVELGLDPTKFNRAQQDAMERFQKQVEKWKKAGQEAEGVGSHIQESFGKATRSVMGLGLALLGAGGLKSFAEQQVRLGVDLGRTATLYGANVEMLSKWEGVAKRAGGTAEGMRGSMTGLVNQFQQFAVTGESGVVPYFRALGVQISDASGHMRGLDDIMLDLSDKFSKMDPAKATFFGHALGFDDATIALLVKGRDAVKKMLDEQERITVVSKQQTEAAADMWKAWETAAQKLQDIGRKLLYDPTAIYTVAVLAGDMETANKYKKASDASATRMRVGAGGGFDFTNSRLGRWLNGQGWTDPPAGTAKTPAVSSSSGSMSRRETEQYIREAAVKRGIDPDVAVAVARSEGLDSYVGDRGSSFGPYQLHYGGVAGGGMAVSGLGDKFTSLTGLDARDQSTIRAQIDFALSEAVSGGWGPWHGWHGSSRAGLPDKNLSIQNLNVYSASPNAAGIARDIHRELSQQAGAGPG